MKSTIERINKNIKFKKLSIMFLTEVKNILLQKSQVPINWIENFKGFDNLKKINEHSESDLFSILTNMFSPNEDHFNYICQSIKLRIDLLERELLEDIKNLIFEEKIEITYY